MAAAVANIVLDYRRRFFYSPDGHERLSHRGVTRSMFLPTTAAELRTLGWDALDVILVTGDAYIDSPFVGVAVIGHVLLDAGYRVGVIAQPDTASGKDIERLG